MYGFMYVCLCFEMCTRGNKCCEGFQIEINVFDITWKQRFKEVTSILK